MSFQYDADSDGYLNIVEMKHLIHEKKCADMPKDLALHLLKLSDTNNDGRLDFEEFYKLSLEHPYFLCEMYIKYCKAVVPKRNDAEEGDVLGMVILLLQISLESAYQHYVSFFFMRNNLNSIGQLVVIK